ncbi:MAG: pyrroline-5-carboxylate reductase [Verrucomicrobia bacterium]|nr:MAG: pyrroline-5-carboxylate reductase [Verrucomicrobiota bacterium]
MRSLFDMKYGFIGGGRITRALVEGLLRAKLCLPQDIIVSSRSPEPLALLTKETGIRAGKNNAEVVQEAELILLAVKPWDVAAALQSCGEALSRKLLVSVVTGKSAESLASLSGARVVRAMPNTGAMAGVSTTAIAPGASASIADVERVRQIFEAVGSVIEIKESLFDAVVGMSGSGPAYIYLIIEALSDGGVAVGLPRSVALHLAIQTVRGAAIFAEQSGLHPALLREMITSPAGTTAAALGVLEDEGMRAAFIRAVRAAKERSEELGR